MQKGCWIQYAVQNSKLLLESGYFFKCTGKMFCRNFAPICSLIEKSNIANMFRKLQEYTLVDRNLADARFFFTSIGDFQRVVFPAYTRASETIILEYQLSESLNSQLSRGASLRPLLSGFSGGLGGQCPEHYLGELDMAYPCWYSLRSHAK